MITPVNSNVVTNFSKAGKAVVEVAASTSVDEKMSLAIKTTNIFRYIGSTSEKLLDNAKHLPKIGVLKILNIALVPAAIYEIGSSIFSAAKTSINEKIDAILGVISTVGTLADIAATFAEGLAAVGAVALKVIGWTTPLSIAAAAVEGVGLALTTKSLIETHRFSKVFNQSADLKKSVEEYQLEDFRKARMLIEEKQAKEKSFIGKHFKTDNSKLSARLDAIESSAKKMLDSENLEEVQEGKRRLQTTMQTLSKRMTTKKWSDALTLLTGVVGLVGLGVLFSPCPPAGFALLAVSGILSMVNFFRDKAVTRRMERELDQLALA